jgi:ferredoxin
VKSEECFGCLTCVSRCPAEGALDLTAGTGKKNRVVQPWLFPLLIALFYLVIGIGIVTDNWHSKIPTEEYQRLIPELQKEYIKQ